MKYLARGAACLIITLILFYCAYSEYNSYKSEKPTLPPENEEIKHDSD